MIGASATFRRAAQRVGKRYADFSEKRPYVCSTLTACGILGWADITAQQLFNKEIPSGATLWERMDKHDFQRTFALTSWGSFHYGICQKGWYLALDRMVGSGGAFRKMFLDVYLWTPLCLIPSFYMITGVLKQHPYLQLADPAKGGVEQVFERKETFSEKDKRLGTILSDQYEHLKRDWVEWSFGSWLFWTPLVYTNMKYVPQHSRIATIVWASFLHKTWMSWLSHREQDMIALADELDATVRKPHVLEVYQDALETATTVDAKFMNTTDFVKTVSDVAGESKNVAFDSLGVNQLTQAQVNSVGFSLIGGGFYLATRNNGRQLLQRPWRFIGPRARHPAAAEAMEMRRFTETHYHLPGQLYTRQWTLKKI